MFYIQNHDLNNLRRLLGVKSRQNVKICRKLQKNPPPLRKISKWRAFQIKAGYVGVSGSAVDGRPFVVGIGYKSQGSEFIYYIEQIWKRFAIGIRIVARPHPTLVSARKSRYFFFSLRYDGEQRIGWALETFVMLSESLPSKYFFVTIQKFESWTARTHDAEPLLSLNAYVWFLIHVRNQDFPFVSI